MRTAWLFDSVYFDAILSLAVLTGDSEESGAAIVARKEGPAVTRLTKLPLAPLRQIS